MHRWCGESSSEPTGEGFKLTNFKDKATGKEVGTALCSAAKNVHGGWVEYMWSKPGFEGNYRKLSYVLTAGNYQVVSSVYDEKTTILNKTMK